MPYFSARTREQSRPAEVRAGGRLNLGGTEKYASVALKLITVNSVPVTVCFPPACDI